MYKSSKPKLKYWSPTKLEDFYRCPRGRFLEKLLHKPLITPALAKGIHIHSAFDSLRLHHLRERKRWSSPETFANVIANDWIRGPVKTGQIRGKTILWEFEGQQYVIKESIRERCRKAYSILIEEAQPLLFLKKSATIETPEHKKYTTARRFEFVGEANGIKIFDDYAHHPSEVSATLSAAREKFPNERIWCAFQPHTFSRTKALFSDFVKSIEESPVDQIIILDIYAAREVDPGNVSSFELAKAIKSKAAVYAPSIEEAAKYLATHVASNDVVISMGAGNIYKLSPLLISKLKNQNG